MADPLRVDPTRTTPLRNRFAKMINQKFKVIEQAIDELIVKENAFLLVANTRYAFLSDPDKLKAYKIWLQQQVDAGLLLVDNKKEPWTNEFIESAYKQGLTRAYSDLANLQGNVAGTTQTKDQFVRETFGSAVSQKRLQLLFTRPFDQLKDITSQMGTQMSAILANGLAHGKGPREIARQLKGEVGLSRTRALRVARTEIINAYAEGQLDSFEKLGVERLGVMSEWLTAGDSKVCPRCSANSGKKFTVEEARGVIPLHPNCRCAWVPFVDTERRKRNRKRQQLQ